MGAVFVVNKCFLSHISIPQRYDYGSRKIVASKTGKDISIPQRYDYGPWSS